MSKKAIIYDKDEETSDNQHALHMQMAKTATDTKQRIITIVGALLRKQLTTTAKVLKTNIETYENNDWPKKLTI